MSSLREDLRARVQGATPGVAVIGPDGRVRRADADACRTLGLEEHAVVGTPLSDLVQLDEGPGERRYVRPDGDVAWLLVDARPEGDEVRVQLRDVTTARSVAEAERATNEQYRTSIEGSWVLDADGRTLTISASAAALLGYVPEELEGRSPLELVHPDDASRLEAALARRQGGARESYEIRWLDRDGKTVWALMAAAPMIGPGGAYAGSFALVTDVTERRRGLHDVLTGLPNRTLALDRLDQALRRRREEDAGALAVLSVDLDRFKRINDAYGVAAGDEVVRVMAERLRSVVAPADTVARLAGDTFVVLCEDLLAEEAAAAVAARIVEALREPVAVDGEQLMLTASVGVALASGGDEDAGALLRDADAAVDRAKARGRDRFELFDEALRARAADRVQLERDLRHAIARDQLFVAHQPIVSVASGRVIGTEALARWRHPERGVIPPGDFIGLAEETGLIGDVGLWVLHQACLDVAARHRDGQALTCHVNLSPVQAVDATLPDRVAEILRATGLPPEALVLELTESSLMEAGEGPLCVMQGIRELGVRLVLDDFGTGYSSLARLRHFPVDGLKIDRSFVSDLESGEPSCSLLVSGIVELARALGLTVVAEGVETTVQLERLERIGCRYAQGYLIARPGDVAQLDRLLAG